VITLATWQAAIISTIDAQFTAAGFRLGYCGERDPRDLKNDHGGLLLNPPAIILDRGPFEVRTHDRGPAGRCYASTSIEWRAYCIERADADNYLFVPDQMADYLRGVLFSHGGNWGLDVRSDELLDPDEIDGEQIDLGLAGHACRVLRWRQAAKLTAALP
jgi:hypothetical protein